MKFKDVFKERWRTPSNFLSALRPFLLPPFLLLSARYAAHPDNMQLYAWVLAVVLAAMLTDFLDGFLARRFHQETRLGRYLDPVADKIVSLGALTILWLHYGFPLWALLACVLREILGVWLGAFLYFRRDMQGKPNMWGKVGVTATGLVVLWYVSAPILGARLPPGHPLLWTELGAALLVGILAMGVLAYARSYWHIVLRRPEKPG
ncbi:MAG: CDP-alcohol phosphatidyltransferase family protein [Leptospirales bacterium]|nr:CDP-alcohol phosphatidyltransferase family protein [Leptospirales bacterium]